MKIKEYIKELLLTNQGVIIPGLGGFVSEYESAAFDISENKFVPPSKKISFNPDYTYQDNLLSEYICKKELIDQSEAKKQIEDFVKDSKFKLTKGDTIHFEGIGSLSQSSKGSIQFTQDKDANLLTDSFGLTSVQAKQKVVPNIQDKPAKFKKSNRKLILLSSIAAFVLILVASSWYVTNGFSDFSIFSFNTTNDQLAERNSIKEITENNLDSIAREDSLKALIVSSIDNNTDKKDALFYQEPDDASAKKSAKEPNYKEFHIIAGSFKRIENAEKFSKELEKKGYNPQIIKSGESLIRIAIYTYTDETEALKKLYKLRENSDIKTVWILKSI